MSDLELAKAKRLRIRYVLGFLYALILTNIAFAVVGSGVLSGWVLVILLNALAITQLWVQLRYFLHLGEDSKSKWSLLMFLFASLVVTIVVFGSLWIMKNLNYNMMNMSPEMDKKMMEDEQIKRETQ